VGVEAARVRQDPDGPPGQPLLLQPPRRVAAPERGAVRRQAEDGDQPRAQPPDGRLELARAGAQLGRVELGRRPRRAVRDVRDADPVREQLGVLLGAQPARGEAGGVQRRPEAVARPCEVVADLRGAQRRVDADEEDAQARPDDRAELGQRP
jgi:hypothetical protein